MFKKFGKLVAFVAMSLVLSFFAAVNVSTEASASGYTFHVSAEVVQRGEPIEFISEDPCLVSPITPQTVSVIFIDSNSEVFVENPVSAVYADGSWYNAPVNVPSDIALGSAVLWLECWDWHGGEERQYEAIDIEVVDQSTTIDVDQVRFGGISTFSSLTPCDANSPVRVDLYSKEIVGYQNFGVHLATRVSEVIVADSSGNWSYEVELHPGLGNTSNPSESLSSPGDDYYFRASCSWGGPNSYGSLKFVVETPEYVALGDSYSSGEGSFNYDLDSGVCHRSSDAYSYYVGRETGFGLPLVVACSGAQTYDIAHAGVSGVPQRNSLSLDTEIVTITIGGNDVGFAEVLEKCAHTPFNTGFGCATDPYLPNAVNDRLSALEGTAVSPVYTNGKLVSSITQVLLEIEEYAPNADIYIAGYPKLFGDDISYYSVASGAPGGAVCGVLPSLVTVSYDDAQWMNAVAEELNDIIEAEVTYAKGLGVSVEYVAPLFGGHALCDSGSSWLNGVILNDATPPKPISESVHPTTEGMWLGYGIAFSSVIP